MVIKILYTIQYFHLTGGEFYHFMDMTITNNQHVKKDNFSDEAFLSSIGLLREDRLDKRWDFAYMIDKNLSVDKEVEKEYGYILSEKIDVSYQYLNGLLFFLWFIKDNSVNLNEVFGRLSYPEGESFSSIDPHGTITNCCGRHEDTSFTKQDLYAAKLLSNQYATICPPKEDAVRKELLENANNTNSLYLRAVSESVNYNQYNPIERAINFLQSARETVALPYKIALYIPIFECLFTTEPGEVTQKVSQRVAFYLGGTSSEKYETYDTIRKAYRIRSRYFHGAQIDKSQKDLEYQMDLSKKVDEITRNVLFRVIMEDFDKFLQKKDVLESFLDGLIFQ